MHHYSISSEERRNVLFGFVVLAIALTWGAVYVGNNPNLANHGKLGHLVSSSIKPTIAITVCGLAYTAVVKWGWKWRPVRWVLRISTPNLNGNWTIEGKSSHDDFQRVWTGNCSIEQSWSEISIRLAFTNSKSRSQVAGFRTNLAAHETELKYEYESTPNQDAPKSMETHFGMTTLCFERSRSPREMEGTYYTDPKNRSNYGTLKFTKDRA